MQPPKRYSLIENNVRATVLKGAEVGEGEREEMKGVRFPNNDTLKDVPSSTVSLFLLPSGDMYTVVTLHNASHGRLGSTVDNNNKKPNNTNLRGLFSHMFPFKVMTTQRIL